MAIIVNQQQPSAGYMFGSGFGQTLGQSLQDLAQDKLEQFKARQGQSRIAKDLEGLGLSNQDAQIFARLPENQRFGAALDYLKQSQPQQIPNDNNGIGIGQSQQQMSPLNQPQGLADLFKELGRGNMLPTQQQQKIAEALNQEPLQNILRQAGLAQQPSPFAPASGTAPQRQLPQPQVQPSPQQPLAIKQPLTAQEYLSSRPELLAGANQSGLLEGETPVERSKREQQEEKVKETKQRRINAANKPFIDRLRARSESARSLKSLAEEMEELLATGEVNTGFKGTILPLWAQNAESQQFAAKSAELQQELASKKAGVASKARLELARQAKANLSQEPETQAALLKKVLKEADQELLYDQIKDDLIIENNGEQPLNLETEVNKKYRELQKSPPLNVGDNIEELPTASVQNKGFIAQLDDGSNVVSNGTEWVPYKGAVNA